MPSTSTTRAAATRKLAGLELPEAFCFATAAAEARLLSVPANKRTEKQRRDLKRIASQAARIERGTL